MSFIAYYSAAPPDLPNNFPNYILTDIKGRIVVSPSGGSTGAQASFRNAGAVVGVTEKQIVVGAADLEYIACNNLDTATVYLQVYNTAAALGTSIFEWIVVGGSQINVGSDILSSFQFPLGIRYTISTTSNSYVAPADPTKYNVQGIYVQ